MASFNTLWQNHPSSFEFPCDQGLYSNQCAIRLSVALQRSQINISTCPAVKCDFSISTHKNIKHFLRAQELANWFRSSRIFGETHKYTRSNMAKMGGIKLFENRKGIIFIQDGWGATDHIDLWNGHIIKNGALDYFDKGISIWFWDVL